MGDFNDIISNLDKEGATHDHNGKWMILRIPFLIATAKKYLSWALRLLGTEGLVEAWGEASQLLCL